VTSVFTVSEQMINILTEQNVRASLATLAPTDVLISPILGDVGAGSFDRVGEAIAAGEEAARLLAYALRDLALPPDQYRERMARRREAPAREIAADGVRIAGSARVPSAALAVDQPKETAKPVQFPEIESTVQRVYSRGDFEMVGLRMLRDADRQFAVIEPMDKAWGPHYLRFGASLFANVGGDSAFTVIARSNRTWINRFGAQWINQAQIGQTPGFLSEFYQPLGAGSAWYLAPRASYLREEPNLYLGEDIAATYMSVNTRLGIDVGRQIGTLGEIRAGLVAGRSRFKINVGLPGLPAESYAINGWTARADLDRLDSYSFPTRGQRARVDIFSPTPSLGADDKFTRAQFEWVGAATWRNNTLAGEILAGGGLGSGSIPAGQGFALGGFQRLSGYNYQRFRAESVAFGSVNYRRVINPPLGLQLGGIVDRFYAGASLEAARLNGSYDPNTPDAVYYSGSLYLAADTALGPMFIAYGQGAGGNRTIWLAIGKPWSPR